MRKAPEKEPLMSEPTQKEGDNSNTPKTDENSGKGYFTELSKYASETWQSLLENKLRSALIVAVSGLVVFTALDIAGVVSTNFISTAMAAVSASPIAATVAFIIAAAALVALATFAIDSGAKAVYKHFKIGGDAPKKAEQLAQQKAQQKADAEAFFDRVIGFKHLNTESKDTEEVATFLKKIGVEGTTTIDQINDTGPLSDLIKNNDSLTKLFNRTQSDISSIGGDAENNVTRDQVSTLLEIKKDLTTFLEELSQVEEYASIYSIIPMVKLFEHYAFQSAPSPTKEAENNDVKSSDNSPSV